MTTITTLFSGGEGVSVGARAAGVTHLDGFEYDNDIAQVARDNGFNVHTADVLSLDPTTLQVSDILHCSPVCTRASVANQSVELNEDGTKEAALDIEFGSKIAQFIDVMQPRIFSLENVYQYRDFRAFKIICAALDRNDYFWDYDNLNSADYGVPQTRRRLILRAMRGSLLPMLPQPIRWVGWYEAIEDLIPIMKPSNSLPSHWLGKVPENDYFLIDCANSSTNTISAKNEPSFTVTSGGQKHPKRIITPFSGMFFTDYRCDARFQSFPDSYLWTDNKRLNCKIIGNSVCPLLYQRIIEPMVNLL